MKRFIAIALVLFTIGCASKVAPSLSVPTQISTLTSNPPLVPSSTAPKSSVTLKPTRTPIATSTPRPTASTFLDIRTPTIEQLSNYLQSALEGFPGWDSNTQLFPEDVNNDGKPDSTKREEDGTLILAIVYADVSGDKQDDIIVFGYDGLIILLWDDNHYNKPFWIPPSWSRGGLSALEVSFQDWTNDGTAEIVHDSNTVGGGTGLWEYNTIRSIIHCQANGCASIWVKLLSQSTDDYNLGGLKRWRLEMQHDKTMDGKPFIRTIDEGFYIYCCIFSESENSTSLNVLTSTLSIYTWTGDVFELTDEQIVSRASHIDSAGHLNALNADGALAIITAKNNYVAGDDNDFCQLTIEGRNIGNQFGCRRNFTGVEWKDITNDNQTEVVITAYSAGLPYDDEGNLLSDEECMHQRIIVYQWDGVNAVEIANVVGCVIEKDLYGVRLQDYDNDGTVEILAAPNGELRNRAYKWNGKRFTLWSEIP